MSLLKKLVRGCVNSPQQSGRGITQPRTILFDLRESVYIVVSPHLFLRVPRHALALVRPLLVSGVEHAHHFHRLRAAPPAIPRGWVRFGRVVPQRGRDCRVRVQVMVHDAEIAAASVVKEGPTLGPIGFYTGYGSLIEAILKIERYLSNSIQDISISGEKFSWTTLL